MRLVGFTSRGAARVFSVGCGEFQNVVRCRPSAIPSVFYSMRISFSNVIMGSHKYMRLFGVFSLFCADDGKEIGGKCA